MRPQLIVAAVVFGLLLVAGGGPTHAGSQPEEDVDPPRVAEAPYVSGEVVRVSGRVRRVGSDPFTELVVTDADGIDWYLDEAGEDRVQESEQETVVIEGVVHLRKIELADGTDLGLRHELHEIELVRSGE